MSTNFNKLLSQMRVVQSNEAEEDIPFPHQVDPGGVSDDEDEFAEAFDNEGGQDDESDDDLDDKEEDDDDMYADLFGGPKRKTKAKPRAKATKVQQPLVPNQTYGNTWQQPQQPRYQLPMQPQMVQPQFQQPLPQQPVYQQPTIPQPQFQPQQPLPQQSTIPSIQPMQTVAPTTYGYNTMTQGYAQVQPRQQVQPIFSQGVNEANDLYQYRVNITQQIQQRFPTLDGPTLITLGQLIVNYARYGVEYDPSIQQTILSVVNAISTPQ